MKTAEKKFDLAHEAFLKFEDSLPVDVNLSQWRTDEKIAVEERGDKLQIFNIETSKGEHLIDRSNFNPGKTCLAPSRATLKAMLLKKTLNSDSAAAIAWMDQALNIEEIEYVKYDFS